MYTHTHTRECSYQLAMGGLIRLDGEDLDFCEYVVDTQPLQMRCPICLEAHAGGTGRVVPKLKTLAYTELTARFGRYVFCFQLFLWGRVNLAVHAVCLNSELPSHTTFREWPAFRGKHMNPSCQSRGAA